MATKYRAWCDCSWHGEFATEARADYAMRRHSCELWTRRRARKRAAVKRRAQLDRTVRPCTHKIAHHEHGDYARYTLDHCRCDPCRAAKGAYEAIRRRRKAYGEVPYVDALEATEHVRELMAAGLGWKRVAKLAGVSNASVYVLLYGRPDRNGGAPRTKARQATVQALLAVPMPTLDDLADGQNVPAAGTRRRMHALQSVGWSVSQIAERAGIDRQVLDGIERGRKQVEAGSARAVREAYDRLWNLEPPQENRWQVTAVTRTRNRAAAMGWPMPMDIEAMDVDDPKARDPRRMREAVA